MVGITFETYHVFITKIDELTNLPKDHWRVLAITNAGRSFILYVDCICDRCCVVTEVKIMVVFWLGGWQFMLFPLPQKMRQAV